MEDLYKAIYGEESKNKADLFDEKLEEIELNNWHWFEKRVNIMSGKIPDRLENYWITRQNGNQLTLGFHNVDELPFSITREVISAFKEVYG